MSKKKKAGAGLGGDWSESGTFLRRPAGGWLHEDRELMDASAINYEVQYLGCVEVTQSMRTLQYSSRTQVTKEAILRLAELAGRVPTQKKRKVPKQISKLLGAGDVRWSGEMNLSISVENLTISNAAGMVIMNHSLPSISFASGGDGITIELIGYVAKDPMHGRACHVFDCPSSAQFVLATIGQAFELRYKIYLKAPKPQPVQVPTEQVMESNAWGSPGASPPFEGAQGIYSDLPDLPATPPPHSMPDVRVYSNLPAFPTEEDGCYENGGRQLQRLGNPYDTMMTTASTHDSVPPESGVYSNPGEVTGTGVEEEDGGIYDNRLLTIQQIPSAGGSDEIDCTPPPQRRGEIPPVNEYGNLELDGSPKVKRNTRFKARPLPNPLANGSHEPSTKSHDLAAKDLYDNATVESAAASGSGPKENMYDDPHYLGRVAPKRVLTSTPAGTYDNPGEIIPSLSPKGGGEDYTDIESQPAPLHPPESSSSSRSSAGIYDKPAAPKQPSLLPKFDDTIYASKRPLLDVGQLKQALPPSPPLSSVDVAAPLPHQPYFHGSITRIEAEALLEREGQFLIRESTKKPGQFVLTGMADDRAQHLLLMDRYGKVKSRDHEFESIPHLVHYFVQKSLPLVVGNSQVYLKSPVANSLPPS